MCPTGTVSASEVLVEAEVSLASWDVLVLVEKFIGGPSGEEREEELALLGLLLRLEEIWVVLSLAFEENWARNEKGEWRSFSSLAMLKEL